jgi:hypothetical protein
MKDINDTIEILRGPYRYDSDPLHLTQADQEKIADWLEELVELREEREEIKDAVRELGNSILGKIFNEETVEKTEKADPIVVKK